MTHNHCTWFESANFLFSLSRGNRTPGSRDATRVATRRSASNLFQLTHMPRGNRAQSIASNGDQKEDKTLLQHSQLRQHGAFWHASVSEQQRSRPCGQNLRVPFPRTVLPPEVEESARAMAATARQKRSYLHHQGGFQHQLFTFRSGHDSDHGSVVRIFVVQSQVLEHYIMLRGTIFPLPGA